MRVGHFSWLLVSRRPAVQMLIEESIVKDVVNTCEIELNHKAGSDVFLANKSVYFPDFNNEDLLLVTVYEQDNSFPLNVTLVFVYSDREVLVLFLVFVDVVHPFLDPVQHLLDIILELLLGSPLSLFISFWMLIIVLIDLFDFSRTHFSVFRDLVVALVKFHSLLVELPSIRENLFVVVVWVENELA